MSKFIAVYGVFKGRFLLDEGADRRWRFIIFVVVLLLFVVCSGHSADGKVVKISRLNKRKQEIRSHYIDAKTNLARMKLESSVSKRVKKLGLIIGDDPPKKIRVLVEE